MSKQIDLEKVAEKAWDIANDPDFDQFEACTALKDAALAIKQAQETIAALEKDAGRLMFACEFDAYTTVEKDRYDYAIECAEENGREEPNSEDELNGLRRLIDTAMEAINAKAD